MRAAILSIGDELTLGQNLDTNSQWLAAQLAAQGVMAVQHRTLADDQDAIAKAIRELAASHDVLVITGGLGPTADDLTREALADAMTPGEGLVADAAAMEHLQAWFTKRGRTMPEMNNKQAARPRTMRIMPNPNGTAPGLAGELGQCQIFSMPGPPREMMPMFARRVLPAIHKPEGAGTIITAMVQEFGMGESVAAEKLGELMDRTRNPMVGTTASDSIVSARIRGEGRRDVTAAKVDSIAIEVERLWEPYAFGRDGSTLVDAVAGVLRAKRLRVATAESCTGGWLGKALVDRARASDYYLGGFVTYANELKTSLLGVPREMIESHGAVSAEVAAAMVIGATERTQADVALSITGVAGPDGGTAAKPVGTVFIALAARNQEGIETATRRFEFTGDRHVIRDRSVKAALQMLRFRLLGVSGETPLIWQAASATSEAGQETAR